MEFIPKGLMKIAQRFSVGIRSARGRVPKGRLTIWTLIPLLAGFAVPGHAQPKAEIRTPPVIDRVQAGKDGRAIVSEMLAQRPPQDLTNSGTLTIRDAESKERSVPIRFDLVRTASNTIGIYQTTGPSGACKLTVTHAPGEPNQYELSSGGSAAPKNLSGNDTMTPFAGSDFWVADLGLEFLQWPDQFLLRKELRQSQSCDVIESINPHPAPGAYARVVSWLDIKAEGTGMAPIVHADAYDSAGTRMKMFDPTELKKVNGQYVVTEMEMRNRIAGTRTLLRLNPAPVESASK